MSFYGNQLSMGLWRGSHKSNSPDPFLLYDLVFDPTTDYYVISTNHLASKSAFLSDPAVAYDAAVGPAITASGYTPTETYNLRVNLNPSSMWTILVEIGPTIHTEGIYETLFTLCNSTDTTTNVRINRDGYATNPQKARSGVADAGTRQGTDTNFGDIANSGNSRFAVTTSATAVKFYSAGTLTYTNTTSFLNSKVLDRVYIGDGPGSVFCWPGSIKKLYLTSNLDDTFAQEWTLGP